MKINDNTEYIAIPRIFRLHAMEILDKEGIEYEVIDKEDLPDGEYDFTAYVLGRLYHNSQTVVLCTNADKDELIKAIEGKVLRK